MTTDNLPDGAAEEALVERLGDLVTPSVLRLTRGLIVWLLSSALIYVGPLHQPRYIALGFLIGVMSLMNATKHFAALSVFILLALAITGPHIAALL